MSRTSSPPTAAGLQRERTALAWERTALAVLANGVLVLLHRPAAEGPATARLVVFGYAVCLAAAVLVVAVRRRRAAAVGRADGGAPRVALVLGCGLGQAVLAGLVLALACGARLP